MHQKFYNSIMSAYMENAFNADCDVWVLVKIIDVEVIHGKFKPTAYYVVSSQLNVNKYMLNGFEPHRYIPVNSNKVFGYNSMTNQYQIVDHETNNRTAYNNKTN